MMVRALFVVPSLSRAGAETQLVDLLNRLDSGRFEKHLFTFEAQLDQLQRLRTHEVTHHQCRRRSRFDLEPVRALARLIDDLQIDVVHCTLQFAMFIGWLATRWSRRRPPVIVAVHTTINRNRKNEFLDRVLYRWLMARCAKVLFVCDAQRAHWIRRFPGLSTLATTIHNGIDISRFDPVAARIEGACLRERLAIPRDAFVIAHVAAFRPEKGHMYVIDALSTLVAENRSVVVLFAGGGPLRELCERRVVAKGMSRNVRFLGALDDVQPVYGAADVVVLPSTSETFSMAMLEALALEVPVVGSDIGGMREAVLNGTTGLLVRPADVAGLAAAFRSLLEDGSLRRSMGRAGRQLVQEKYTQTTMVAKTAQLIYDVSISQVPSSAKPESHGDPRRARGGGA